MDSMYHDGHRILQDRYRGRKVADRIEQHRKHSTFSEDDKTLIESVPFFFLATAHGDAVDCSMKGGMPGFIRVTAPDEVAWPDYDGNRMLRSNGSIGGTARAMSGPGGRAAISARARSRSMPRRSWR